MQCFVAPHGIGGTFKQALSEATHSNRQTRMKRTDLMQAEGMVFPYYQPIGQVVGAQVILGSPSAGCRGVGVCRVVPLSTRLQFECPLLPVKLGFVQGGRLKFLFEKASLTAEIKTRHFSAGVFQVSAGYSLPKFICRQLGCITHRIEPGIYAVMESDRYLAVEF